MSLSAGHRLGPYEVVAKLGEGGMGEVYRARDTRLNRQVAVKVLPQHLSADAAARARFEREAKTISSLDHPHICTLHDIGRDGGIDYLVMELVQGETLAHRLAAGKLPIAETLRLGGQIADALDRAHRAGVVHRDLKPANVMVTKAGAKLLDFGLARETRLTPADAATGSPTVANPLTAEGAILGTFQYMAPEQLEGKEADARADLWALGCVIYEMATGQRAFDGTSYASLITAIMGAQPKPITLVTPAAPPGLDRLVGACLEKEPADRIQSAHDVKLQLSWIAAGDEPAGSPRSPAATWKRRSLMVGALLVAVFATGVLVNSHWFHARAGRSAGASDSPSAAVVGKSLLTDLPGVQGNPSLSPDGKSLVFVSRGHVDDDIFFQRVGGENPVNLTEAETGNDEEPAFSPDGEHIAFASERDGGGIFVMGATGESPKKIVSGGAHPAWSPDGREIVYSTERVLTPYWRSTSAKLWVVELATGEKKRLSARDGVEPAWSPLGHRIAFWTSDRGQRDIKTMAADGGSTKAVTNDAATDWSPFWAPDGRSLYFFSDRGGSPDLWRIALDEATGDVRGEPEPVTSGVAPFVAGSISADGHRIAVQVSQSRGEILRGTFDPAAARVQGGLASIFASANTMSQLELSADGQRVAYRTSSPHENVFVMRSDGSERRRLTDDGFRNRGPQWIRNDWVIFYSNRSGNYQAWLIRQDGTEPRMLTNRPDGDVMDPVVSPDGGRVAMKLLAPLGPSKLAIPEVEERWFAPGAVPSALTPEDVDDGFDPRAWSPDGRTVGGIAFPAQGPVMATYSLDSRRVERHDKIHLWNFLGFAWLPDSRRVLYWDVLRGTAVVSDLDGTKVRDLADIPGPSEMKLSRDGRTLLVNRTILEGNIWLLTLK